MVHKMKDTLGNMTIRQVILGSKNSLNFIRFFLAALVILGHAYPVALGETSRVEFVAGMAVNLFFCISGFLILASAQRVGLLSYIWRRFLRIFPGYWVSLLFIVFICVPIAYFLGQSKFIWDSGQSMGYLVNNFDLHNLQYEMDGVLEGNPYHAWNGSAWTLWYEFIAYLCLIPLAYTPWVRKYQKITVTVSFLLSLMMFPLLSYVDATTNMYWTFARLVPMFLAGSLIYVWGDYIKVRTVPVVAAVILTVVIHFFNNIYFMNSMQLLFAYGILGLAGVLKIYWGYVNDLSYGVYIYAFPVQQLLVSAGSSSLGILANSALTLIISMGLAYLSWNFVEKPAMGLKKLVPTQGLKRHRVEG